MNLDLPPHLETVRRMLEGSLRLRPSEPVPAVPAGLLDDLNRKFVSQRIVIEPESRVSWKMKLKALVATPAFGLAAAAVMVFGVVAPLVHHQSGPGAVDSFRGVTGTVEAPAMIVLVDSPADLANTLSRSGQFEASSVIAVGDLKAASDIAGPKVILDFESATIRAIDDQGETLHEAGLPTRISDLTLSVADALSRL